MNQLRTQFLPTVYRYLPLIVFGSILVVLLLSGGAAGASGLDRGADAAKPDGVTTDLFGGDGGIFRTITNLLLFLIGAIAVIMLIIGGIRYVVSGGDQGAVTAAKNTILYAIVGLIIAFLAYAAVDFVIGSLSVGGGSDIE